jgi:hypothetical protein
VASREDQAMLTEVPVLDKPTCCVSTANSRLLLVVVHKSIIERASIRLIDVHTNDSDATSNFIKGLE